MQKLTLLHSAYLHHNLPNHDFSHSFAGSVRTSFTGPKSIAGILAAHKSPYDPPTLILGNIASGEADLVDRAPWPDPQSYKLLSTCIAIITVLDNVGVDAKTLIDGYIRLGRESHKHSLLLVRTGDECHLSCANKLP